MDSLSDANLHILPFPLFMEDRSSGDSISLNFAHFLVHTGLGAQQTFGEFNWIMFCFYFLLTTKALFLQLLPASPQCLLSTHPNTPNSPLHSVLEYLVSSPDGDPFLSLSILFTPTLTQIQKLPWLESLETQVHGWLDQILLSNLQWHPKLEFQIHYSFRKHFLYGQVLDYSSSRLGYLGMF